MAILLLMTGAATATAETADIIAESLASPDRLAQDREHDPSRHPDQVLEFFGIGPGMAVLDLFSGAGYYTEILSHVVGSTGKVVAHNNPAYLDYARDELERRFEDGRLPNVERITAEAIELELPDSSFDAALVMLTWHDFYYVDEENAWPPIDPAAIVRKLCGALKPGAVLGVTDHVAESGSDPRKTAQELHRIDPRRIRDDLADSCFEFEGEIDVLRNPADRRDQPMFAEGIRDHTDRVVYRFRRMP
jgi:predicted methyltransferase